MLITTIKTKIIKEVVIFMAMTISTSGLNLIKEFEGLYLKAYKCPAGVWTIGYGHTKNVKQGEQISKERAEYLLKQDLKECERDVEKTTLNLNQNQFDALVSFTFNCGAGNLKKLIHNRNKQQIADALLLYNKANGKELTGLTRRRKAERELFLKPVNNTNNNTKTNLQIAREVIAGKWGNGSKRKQALTKAGYNYSDIQKLVNALLK